jgi:hypothetical protein
MDVWKYVVAKETTLARLAHSRGILFNTRNKFHISRRPCIILFKPGKRFRGIYLFASFPTSSTHSVLDVVSKSMCDFEYESRSILFAKMLSYHSGPLGRFPSALHVTVVVRQGFLAYDGVWTLDIFSRI